MASSSLAYANERREHREDVHFRTAVIDSTGRPLQLLIVNISPNGLMARCDQPISVDTKLTYQLPGLGMTVAEVRWTLGGRIGCEFSRPIEGAAFYALLARLPR